MMRYLKDNSTLKVLQLNDCKLSAGGWDLLADMLHYLEKIGGHRYNPSTLYGLIEGGSLRVADLHVVSRSKFHVILSIIRRPKGRLENLTFTWSSEFYGSERQFEVSEMMPEWIELLRGNSMLKTICIHYHAPVQSYQTFWPKISNALSSRESMKNATYMSNHIIKYFELSSTTYSYADSDDDRSDVSGCSCTEKYHSDPFQ